ncbi:MAG TPA: FHA domain-containing protein [Candidatus Saccharimonadales bacterium]|nr:FHA domain-containing protein [Candidatus Saccharimonadales bacterium]
MTETQSAEYVGRHRKLDFEEVVPADVTVRAEAAEIDPLVPGVEYPLELNRPLAVGEDYDVLGAIRASENDKIFYILDVRKTEADEHGVRMVDGTPVEGDFVLVSDESESRKRGYTTIHEQSADAITPENPTGVLRIGRGYHRDEFDYPQSISKGHFDIRLTPEGELFVSDIHSMNGIRLVQGESVESAFKLPSHDQEHAHEAIEAEEPHTEPIVATASERTTVDVAEDAGTESAVEHQAATPEAEEQGEMLTPSEIFASPEALRGALQHPERMHPGEYAALTEVVATWHELQVAATCTEEWEKLKPLALQLQSEAETEANSLSMRIGALEQLQDTLIRLRSNLDVVRPEDVSRLPEDMIPEYTPPQHSPLKEQLATATEDARARVRKAAGNAEQELDDEQAFKLLESINYGQGQENVMGILATMQAPEGTSRDWFTKLQQIEELLIYSHPASDESFDYRVIRDALGTMNTYIGGADYSNAYHSATEAYVKLQAILDGTYQRRGAVYTVTNSWISR